MELKILDSRQNPNYMLIRQLNKYFGLIEVLFEVADNNRPKDPIIFRIMKKVEEYEVEATLKRFTTIIQAEFPGDEWFNPLEGREAAE